MMTGKQLKNAILQLAIQGKLVPQDAADEPASALLAKIRKEKEQLVKAGKLKKKDLATTPITDEEKPFEIPESWEWVRLGEITDVLGGYAFQSQDIKGEKGTRVIRISDFNENGWVNNKIARYNDKEQLNQFEIKINDILLAMTGGTVGKSFFIENLPERMLLNQRVALIRSLKAVPKFVDLLIKSPLIQNIINERKNSTNDNISMGDITGFVIPLPPLAEQHRIVSKIEEFMPLVEEYGAAQEKLNQLNEALPEALKKSILQQAIQGKLVAQDANDEPASALLAKIRKEKEQLVKAGKLKKKDLETTPITDEEKPFEIPESWEWVRLGEIGIFERGNGIKRDETFSSGKPCVRYGEMYTKYRYNPTFDKTFSYTSPAVFNKCRKAHNGDLFMALTGENKQDIALAAQYTGNEEIAVGGDLCHFSILQAYALFFVYAINSQFFSDKKELLATGDIIVHISADKLGSIPIPLPPLAEQHRIVAKIEELMAMVDGMK